MKTLFCILFIFTLVLATAQPSSSDLRKHQKKVERSVQKQEAVWSLDTVFHAGQPVCLAVQQNKVLWSYDVSVRSLAGEELIFLKEEFYPPEAPAGSSGQEHWFVWTVTVSFGIHGHGGNAHLTGAAHHTEGYLATVGYKNFLHRLGMWVAGAKIGDLGAFLLNTKGYPLLSDFH